MKLPEIGVYDITAFHTWMGDDGIARTIAKKKVVDLNEAKENSAVINALEGASNFPLIVDLRKVVSITKEARDHFAMKGRETRVIAIALIIGSPISRVIANFYIGLSKPVTPVKMFNNQSKAEKWCLSFVE